MKVLQVGLSYNAGGIERCIMDYFGELKKKNVRFDFVCMYDSLAYEDKIRDMGGQIFYLPNVKRHPVRFTKELEKLLKNEQYDVVHVNMLSAANITPLKVAHKMKVKKIIAHSHNSSSPGITRNILHFLNKRYIKQYATDYFACSENAGKWLFSQNILKDRQVVIIHNAIPVERFLFNGEKRMDIRKELGLQDKWIIGHVGRFEEQKNHTFLLDIFKELCTLEKDAALVLIGEGELMEEMKNRVRHMKIEEKVHFLGVRRDVNELLTGMDVFLCPSLFEGAPIVVIEAQAAGVISFLSDVITKEINITGRVRFISLRKDPLDWAKRIQKEKYVKRDKNDNEDICKKFYEKGYMIEVAGERLFNLYH